MPRRSPERREVELKTLEKAFDRLHEHPHYPEVLRLLTNGQGEWKLNNEGHVVHFKAKHLAYIPKV